MTPKLQQAIKLFQLSNMEFSKFVEAGTVKLNGVFEDSGAKLTSAELIDKRSNESSLDPASAKSVRFQIQNLIGAEMPDNILSDEKFDRILIDGETNIARRTLSKYRETMHVLSSVQRQREKALYP